MMVVEIAAVDALVPHVGSHCLEDQSFFRKKSTSTFKTSQVMAF